MNLQQVLKVKLQENKVTYQMNFFHLSKCRYNLALYFYGWDFLDTLKKTMFIIGVIFPLKILKFEQKSHSFHKYRYHSNFQPCIY